MRLLKKSTILLAVSGFSLTLWGTYPSGYYDSLEGKCGKELRKAAKEIVARHTVISYGADTWEAFAKTDTRTVNGKEVWWDMYSNSEIPVSAGRPNSSVMNIEHSVANSWWGGTKNDAYKDLFHLNPSDSKANSAKGNFPLGEISGTPTYDNGVTFVGSPKSGLGGGCTKVYEPAAVYKGDFARVFFYMFTVYDNISWKGTAAASSGVGRMYSVTGGEAELSQWATDMMLRWAQEDEVSEKETDRNEAIYGIQHNRNPFIDLPHLARHIWGDLKNTPFHAEVENPDPGTDPTPDDPSEGVKTLLNCTWDGSTQMSYYENEGWENLVEEGSFSGWFIKTFEGNNYASASAYKSSGDGPFVAYLVSPEIEVPSTGATTLTFRTQGAYGVSDSNLKVYICHDSQFDVNGLEQLAASICIPPASGSKPVYCDWVPSGSIDLSGFAGTNRIVWRYESGRNASNTATYCLDDVLVTTDGTSVIVEEPEAIGEVTAVYTLTGVRCDPSRLQPGIYIFARGAKVTKEVVR